MNVAIRDENGSPVDWAVAYKTPALGSAASGYGYAYYDANVLAAGGKILLSPHSLDKPSGWMAETLALLQYPAVCYTCWNDERPDGKADNGDFGHTKGFLAWNADTETGLYQLHSWPLFPLLGATKAPTPIYGQTFCGLSLSRDMTAKIAAQMLSHQEPQVYDSRFGANDMGSALAELAQGLLTPKPAPSFDVLDGETIGGMPFKILAENRQNRGNFWNEVEAALGVPLRVETWIRGPVDPSTNAAGVHVVMDVKAITLHPLGIPLAWGETLDHAKWAISDDPTEPWVIFADKNRMHSQEARGGGGIAIKCLPLWAALSQTDLIVPLPGTTRADAIEHIQRTHKKAA